MLRELCEGHFNHDNLCRVLDVSLDRAPVLSWKGALLGAISGRDDLGSCIVKEAHRFLHLFPLLSFLSFLPPLLTGEVQFNTQYVVFEYCSGSDLFNFLVTGPFEKTKRCVYHSLL